jgi:ubiquinone/menaquinone biosynthesis C-methylase UbiE
VVLLIRQLLSREISLVQALLAISHFLSPKRIMSGDDFNWDKYHLHYREEISSIERKHRLILGTNDFKIVGKSLQLKSLTTILPSHHVLYETLLNLPFQSALEVGSGGGDHLRNLSRIFETRSFSGVDISASQVAYAVQRHPELEGSISILDASTQDTFSDNSFDLVYSHAVLMHISERSGRLQAALMNMLRAARNAVVLVENWQQHDFLMHAKVAAQNIPSWENSASFFVHESSVYPGTFSLVITKASELKELDHYGLLTGESPVRPH